MSMHNHFSAMNGTYVADASGWEEAEEGGFHDDSRDGSGSGSEYDDDEEEPRRRRSYGDAEDFMLQQQQHLDLHAGDTTTNSTTRTTTTTTTATQQHQFNTNGLHHRGGRPQRLQSRNHPQTPDQQRMNFYETPTPKRKSHVWSSPFGSLIPQAQAAKPQQYNYRRPKWIQYGLMIGFALYIILLIQTSSWLVRKQQTEEQQEETMLSESPNSPWTRDWMTKTGAATGRGDGSGRDRSHSESGRDRLSTTGGAGTSTTNTNTAKNSNNAYLSQSAASIGLAASSLSSGGQWSVDIRQLREASMEQQIQRAHERQDRTRPVTIDSSNSGGSGGGTKYFASSSSWYSMEGLPMADETEPIISRHQDQPSASLPATTEQLCGLLAQEASQTDPSHYPASAALRQARVFITGILSPIGMTLAMRLHQECGVEMIGGVDFMYPNTVSNRLSMVTERLQLLASQIPEFVRPMGLPFVGLLPKTKAGQEEFDLLSWQPTHIIHLATYAPEALTDTTGDPAWRNSQSPYQNATHWLTWKSSTAGMEQLLQQIISSNHQSKDITAETPSPPQLIHVTVNDDKKEMDKTTSTLTWQASKMAESVLTQTYKIPLIHVQLPSAVYGEWSIAGSPVHDAIENVIQGSDLLLEDNRELELLHVDDVVDALISLLQYQPPKPISVDLHPAATVISAQRLKQALQTLWVDEKPAFPTSNLPSMSNPFHHSALTTWTPKIALEKGIVRTMAWYLHRLAPYGSHDSSKKRIRKADDFLKAHGQTPCSPTDWQCHKSHEGLPCLSECNIREQCQSSVFDSVQPLVYNVTEGCQIVLYTASLGYNVRELDLRSEYMDDLDIDDTDPLICNFAFVPRDSSLVKTVTSKVPNEQLKKFGISPVAGKDNRDLKLDGMNGRLLYRGWILLWVPDTIEELNASDRSLLKLSPSKLFHPDVGRAVFVEENFGGSPNIDDVSFLVDSMKRKALPKRTLKKDVHEKTSFGKEVVTKKKFRLPSEPHRRASILFAPLKIPNDPNDATAQRYRKLNKKIKLNDATKFMRYEWGVEKESSGVKRQREFYEKAASYINRNSELRSVEEPWYRYDMRHWVRTRWVVHDLHLEESRLLRCDWYQEHISWGTQLDQLSFAHVMAVRELKRRMAHKEPDDHVKTFIEQHPYLKDLTDSHEWYAMETDANMLYTEPTQWVAKLPDHLTVEEEPPVEDIEPHSPTPLYIRIMSERVMAISRTIWTKEKEKMRKKKKKEKKK